MARVVKSGMRSSGQVEASLHRVLVGISRFPNVEICVTMKPSIGVVRNVFGLSERLRMLRGLLPTAMKRIDSFVKAA